MNTKKKIEVKLRDMEAILKKGVPPNYYASIEGNKM